MRYDQDTYEQADGRELLHNATDADPDYIDSLDGWEVETWLEELGYEWDGSGWVTADY